MADTRTRVLAALVGLQLALGAIALVTVEEPQPETHGVAFEATDAGESSRPGDPATGATAPPAAPGSAPSGAEEPAAAATSAPTQIPAPRPGTYRYSYKSKSSSGFSSTTFVDEENKEIERRIERISESPDEIIDRRHTPSRVVSSGEDGSKGESRSYEERSWRPDGESLRREVHHSTATQADGSKTEDESECDWEPDRLQLVFPLRVGLEWSWESSCSSSDADAEATTTNKGTAKVVATRELDIGGTAVPTFVVELTATEDTSGRLGENRDGSFRSRSELSTTSYFAPSLGLSVRVEAEQTQDMTFEGSQGGAQNSNTTQTSTSELLSTEPR